jgi:hypothetical protein
MRSVKTNGAESWQVRGVIEGLLFQEVRSAICKMLRIASEIQGPRGPG